MTKIAQDTFAQIAADLVGMELSHLWRGYGSAIFLEFGELTPATYRLTDGRPGAPTGAISLGIEWTWRIEKSHAIICGSSSNENLWEPAFALLRGARVSGLVLFARLPEIDVVLDDEFHIVSFATAEARPQWALADRRATPPIWLRVRHGALFQDHGEGWED